jgi:phage shock protein A
MHDPDSRFAALEATVEQLTQQVRSLADVKDRMTQHEAMRSTAIDALAGLSDRLARVQARVAAAVPQHPATVERQQAGTLEHYARIASRVHGLEEGYHELTGITVGLVELIRDCMAGIERVEALLKDFNRRMDG